MSSRLAFLICTTVFVLTITRSVPAQYTVDDRHKAIDAVAGFLREMGDEQAAATWTAGWEKGIYTFARLDGDTEAQASPGDERIEFSDNMLAQLTTRGTPDWRVTADWAATFQHELMHTRQGKVGWAAAEWSHMAGMGQWQEAEAWGKGFEAYWRWLRRANRNYKTATGEDERQRYAREIVDLSSSFRVYYDNYKKMKFGALPKGTGFLPLGGSDATALTLDEAVREAEKIRKSMSSRLQLAVRLNKTTYRLKAGEVITLIAHPMNSWDAPSYVWKAGSTRLSETGDTLTRNASVDETITVTVQDNRNQKASASCDVIVEKPPASAGTTMPAAPKAPAATPPPERKPASADYAWVFVGQRTNDWQSRLDSQNAAMKGWKDSVSASEGSVTIKQTYTGDRKDLWMRKGMSQSGTATWTPPPKSTIRVGQIVSVDLTTLNAPRDHSNFFGLILIKVEAWRLGKDGVRTGGSSSFTGEKGQTYLGYGSPKGNQTKSPIKLTVTRKFGAGSTPGERMAIGVIAQGGAESVITEYIYEWKQQ